MVRLDLRLTFEQSTDTACGWGSSLENRRPPGCKSRIRQADEAFKWVQEVYERSADLESFRQTGKFLTLDTKILAALSRVAQGRARLKNHQLQERLFAVDKSC